MFCYPTTTIYNKLGNVDLLIAYTNIAGTFFLILSLYKKNKGHRCRYSEKAGAWKIRGSNWGKGKSYVFFNESVPALGLNKPPIRLVLGSFHPGVKSKLTYI